MVPTIDALDKKGQGPGEYMSISDFHVDKAGTIYVNCGTNKRILTQALAKIEESSSSL